MSQNSVPSALKKITQADRDWLTATFSRNRMIFGGWSMNGGAGGSDGGDGGTGGDNGGSGGAGDGGDGGTGGDNGGGKSDKGGAGGSDDDGGKDLGFPKDTPVAEMKPEEQAAYWKHQSRKHETRATEWSKVGKTPAEVQAELENLRREKMSDSEKAVADAKAEGRAEAASEYGPKMARLAFETALSHVDEDRRKVLIDNIDLTKVINESGDVDTAKVKKLVDTLAPSGKGGTNQEHDFGGGHRGGTRSGRSGGKAEAQRRFGNQDKTNSQGA